MKQKNISKDKYIEEFCRDRRMRDRRVIYVSNNVHRKLRRIANLFKDSHVTLSSLADAILENHINAHNVLFETLRQEDYEKFQSLWPQKENDDFHNKENEVADE